MARSLVNIERKDWGPSEQVRVLIYGLWANIKYILQPEMQVPVKIYMLIKKNRGHHAVEFSSLTGTCPE